jgi:hypothetical protein
MAKAITQVNAAVNNLNPPPEMRVKPVSANAVPGCEMANTAPAIQPVTSFTAARPIGHSHEIIQNMPMYWMAKAMMLQRQR